MFMPSDCEEVIEHVEQLINRGNYREALQFIEDTKKNRTFTPIESIRCKLLESRALRHIGQNTDSFDLVEEAIEESQTIGQTLLEFEAIIHKIVHLNNLYRYEEGFSLIKYGEKLLEELKKNESEEVKKKRSHFIREIGRLYQGKGDFNNSLLYFNEHLAICKEIGDKQSMAGTLNNIGILYYCKGDYTKASEYYTLSLPLLEEIGNKQHIALCTNNIGLISQKQGDLDRALKYFEKALKHFEKIGNNADIALALNNLGRTYNQKGELYQAQMCLERSLELKEKIGDNSQICYALYSLVSVHIDNNDLNQAKYYLERLKQVDYSEDKTIDQYYRLAEAMILKKSSRSTNRAEAEKLLRQISNEKSDDHEVTISALLNLCDLLIEELRISGEQEVLTVVQQLTDDLIITANKQLSHSLKAETLWLKSKISLLNLNMREATHFLNQAELIAEEKGLRRLAIKISLEHDSLINQRNKWDELTQQNAPFEERINFAGLEELLFRMIQQGEIDLPETENEKPVLLIIQDIDGSTIFSENFYSDDKLDSALIGGFLAAINSFVKETFSTFGSIERIKHQNYTLILKNIDSLVFVYAFEGQSFTALMNLNSFTEDIISLKEIWDALEKAIGSPKSLEQKHREILKNIAKEKFFKKIYSPI